MTRELRPYQSRAIDQLAVKVFHGKKRLIFQLPTGAGKTVSFAGIVHRFIHKQQKRALILVHREELLRQAWKTLVDWYGIVGAPVTADKTYLPNVMAYVAMVETANNRLKKNPQYFGNVGLVIVDECHLGNFKKLYSFFPDAIIIGCTATPIAATKKDPLKNYFDDIVCGVDIPTLIQEGSLVQNLTYHIGAVNRKDLAVKNGEFDDKAMGEVFGSAKHVQNCVAAYRKYGQGTKTLIFNCNVEHSKKVDETFRAFGLPSRHLDAESLDRAQVIQWFKQTPGAILNNVGILTTGFDEPSVQTIIVNKSTMSLPLWLQMTGRGSRPYPGKEGFTIVDMGGNALEHGDWNTVHDWEDIFNNPDKPKEGGEAPQKPCKGCKVMIHASYKRCPHCGAENIKEVIYDKDILSFELVSRNKPLEIDLVSLIEQNKEGKPYRTIHQVKLQLIFHAKRAWKIRRLDDATADKLVGLFQAEVKKWCTLQGKAYSSWHQEVPTEWFLAELKRVFKYEKAIGV